MLATLPPVDADRPCRRASSSTPVFTGLTLPTAMAFSPDRKVYVAEERSDPRVPECVVQQQDPFLNLSSQVFDSYDRGLLRADGRPASR
jgi:hypothetical protein